MLCDALPVSQGLATDRPDYDALAAARVREVGTRFLKLRPWIAGVGVTINGGLLRASGAPDAQLMMVGAAMSALLLGFSLEAIALRRVALSARWLFSTLIVTALVIGLGCGLTGGAQSPMVPLVFAPVVIAFAAFARGRAALGVALTAALVIALLAIDPLRGVLPPVASPYLGWMALVSTSVSLVLARIGVTGLADAYQSAGESAARMRDTVLADATARAREADAIGAKVAHEVRNPLTSIKGLVQLVARRDHEARDQKRLAVVLEEVERVEEILNDYLSFSRPMLPLDPRPLDLRALLEESASLLEMEAASAQVSIHVEGESLSVRADPRRLREALLNLTRNAIAAMPSGGKLHLSVARAGADQARIEVRDRGTGMDAATREKIGTPYFTTRAEGTGLGVTLARSALVAHGGSLAYESTEGVGTCAILTLPMEPPLELGHAGEEGPAQLPVVRY